MSVASWNDDLKVRNLQAENDIRSQASSCHHSATLTPRMLNYLLPMFAETMSQLSWVRRLWFVKVKQSVFPLVPEWESVTPWTHPPHHVDHIIAGCWFNLCIYIYFDSRGMRWIYVKCLWCRTGLNTFVPAVFNSSVDDRSACSSSACVSVGETSSPPAELLQGRRGGGRGGRLQTINSRDWG